MKKNNPNEVFLSVVKLVTPVTPYPIGVEKEAIGEVDYSSVSLGEFRFGKLGIAVPRQW